MKAASSAAKNASIKRSKNRLYFSSPRTDRSASRTASSLPGYPVMKFSMFIQPPSPKPRSRTTSPEPFTNSRPRTDRNAFSFMELSLSFNGAGHHAAGHPLLGNGINQDQRQCGQRQQRHDQR